MKKEDYTAISKVLKQVIDDLEQLARKLEFAALIPDIERGPYDSYRVNQDTQRRLEHYAIEQASPVAGDPKCPRCGSKNLLFLQHSGLFDCIDCSAVFEQPSTGPESAT
jgi:ribosomal protein S27AE